MRNIAGYLLFRILGRITGLHGSYLPPVLLFSGTAAPSFRRTAVCWSLNSYCLRSPLIQIRRFNNKQQVFLDFVLSHYIRVGVEELDQEKLTPLLRLKYHNSISDALADLGQAEEIGQVFAGFQKYLYQPQAFA